MLQCSHLETYIINDQKLPKFWKEADVVPW